MPTPEQKAAIAAALGEDFFEERPPVPAELRTVDEILYPILYFHKLAVVAGLRGAGKSALLMTMARHVALNLGHPVIYVSAEYPPAVLRLRLLAGLAEMAVHQVQRLDLTAKERARLDEATKKLDAADISVHGGADITLDYLEDAILETEGRSRKPVVFVDHLQAVLAAERRQADPADEYAVLRDLKLLASLAPMVVTSWVSTSWAELRKRSNQVPTRMDVSEPIEQFADKLVTVSRQHGSTMDLAIYDKVDSTFDYQAALTLQAHFARVVEA